MRALLCLDGDRAGELVDLVLACGVRPTEWLLLHVVDTRPDVDLDVLRRAIPGAGHLGPRQQTAIEVARIEHAEAAIAQAEAALRERGLRLGLRLQRAGEPGREICAAATASAADLVVVRARRRPGQRIGPPSVGHTARFVLDHAPCPVLLLRGR